MKGCRRGWRVGTRLALTETEADAGGDDVGGGIGGVAATVVVGRRAVARKGGDGATTPGFVR